ncbi:hypothetical protein ASPSYDRAFT_48123 [Aspergillus sydowii CBS 593.65]|uniref:Uncharacterized protein n=1 Tax=Aspergillus sydowii CBS 593.65 TaxID=1036612 RepID=A0A1L9T8X4_9EURO|nr:uncharacterized protein ASPSYDRAFT_48123 [Aspergillus sydowii CBS 593.65]OJJ55866.1 hypothetical protein ASPSYDRAFT_48123 [Aspergillus sydowii CBS 593.65]
MAGKGAFQTYSIQPHLHKSVAALAKAHSNFTFTFRHGDTDRKATNIWDTNVMGKFTCSNGRCRRSG